MNRAPTIVECFGAPYELRFFRGHIPHCPRCPRLMAQTMVAFGVKPAVVLDFIPLGMYPWDSAN